MPKKGGLGRRYVELVLSEIRNTHKHLLPRLTTVAERAAEQIISGNGHLLAAGDEGFVGEFVWRGGGFSFCKRLMRETKEKRLLGAQESDTVPYYLTEEYQRQFTVGKTEKNDVILLGYDNELERIEDISFEVSEILREAERLDAMVVLFCSRDLHEKIRKKVKSPNLLPVIHALSHGGMISVKGKGWKEKICPAATLVNKLNLWLFHAELIGAFLRRGRIPAILLSATYESPQIFNVPLIENYTFIPAFNVEPVRKGLLGTRLIQRLTKIAHEILSKQQKEFAVAASWLADATRDKTSQVHALFIEPPILGQKGDPKTFQILTEASGDFSQLKQVQKNDVILHIGMNWYQPDIAGLADRSGCKLIYGMALVRDLPPKPVNYRTQLIHLTSFKSLPKRPDRVYIDLKFEQYDGCLQIPGYPVPAIPTSWLSVNLVYNRLVADTVGLMVRNPTPS